jgi:hypothetical protein
MTTKHVAAGEMAHLKAATNITKNGTAGLPHGYVELLGCYRGPMDSFNKLRSALSGTAKIPFYLVGENCKGTTRAIEGSIKASAYGERAKWMRYILDYVPMSWDSFRDPLVPFLRMVDGSILEGEDLRKAADAIEASREAFRDSFYYNLCQGLIDGFRKAYVERRSVRMVVADSKNGN